MWEHTNERMQAHSCAGDTLPQSGLYVLKHKDIDVAMVQIDMHTGRIGYVLAVYQPEELPAGISRDGRSLPQWWALRAIPESRRGLRQVLSRTGVPTSQALMLRSYGLSLTDHYWMQPVGRELHWDELNFFKNDFSDELGSMLTDTETQMSGQDTPGALALSPSSSVNGDMKKKWVIKDGIRCLMKVSGTYYGQQAVNEVIASRLHERLKWKRYVRYQIEEVNMDGKIYPCSLSPLFTSEAEEFVSAYQILMDQKIPNDTSLYEALTARAVELGMEEEDVRSQLEYTVMTDFILSNVDRHLNNMGFMYDPKERRLTGMAPIFDTGNALFYDRDVIPHKRNLLELQVNSLCKREAEMLRFVRNGSQLDLDALRDFPEEAEALLTGYTEMPGARAGEIAETIREKAEYLRLFYHGKKIWKRERYW